MKRQRDIERVFKEIGRVVSKLQKGKPDVGESEDFEVELWNGIGSGGDNTPAVRVSARNTDSFESKALTVEKGLRDVLTQMYRKLGFHLGDYDFSNLPVDAFGELMKEIVEIAAAMHPEEIEPKVGRRQGPTVALTIDFINPEAEIYFARVHYRFLKRNGYPSCRFYSGNGLSTMQAIEDVVGQAHERLKRYALPGGIRQKVKQGPQNSSRVSGGISYIKSSNS